MARITVEDCLEVEQNRFSLVRLASVRAKQLLSGREALTNTKGNKAVVSALREIADRKVSFRDPNDILPPAPAQSESSEQVPSTEASPSDSSAVSSAA